MRLYPPAFINGRVAVRDCELGGYAVPAGAMVMLNVVGTHHHPGYWDDPEGYDPGVHSWPDSALSLPGVHSLSRALACSTEIGLASRTTSSRA